MLTCVCQVTDMFTDLPLSWAASPGSCRKQLQNFEEKASRGPQMMTWSKRCQTMYIIWIKKIFYVLYIICILLCIIYIYYVYCILYWLIAIHKSMYIYPHHGIWNVIPTGDHIFQKGHEVIRPPCGSAIFPAINSNIFQRDRYTTNQIWWAKQLLRVCRPCGRHVVLSPRIRAEGTETT